MSLIGAFITFSLKHWDSFSEIIYSVVFVLFFLVLVFVLFFFSFQNMLHSNSNSYFSIFPFHFKTF